MNKRIWGIIIVIFSLLIIAAIIYFIFFNQTAVVPEPIAETPITGSQATGTLKPLATANQPAVQPLSPLKKPEVKADDLARMASSFAERFGSFSNQSDYGNLRDLQIFMTSTMKTWAQDYINTSRLKKADTSIYYGIVTKSILSEVKSFDADLGQAEILVKTQRRESTGVAGNSSVYYQDLTVKYRREGTAWRVDGAFWQNK